MSGKRRIATATVRGSRKDAERELRRLLRTIDTNEHVDPTRMTVGKWLAQWLDAIRGELSPKSHERYSEIVENYLVPEIGALPILKLTPPHIQTLYNKLATGGRRDGKEGGLSAASRRYVHRVLRSALSRAVEQGVTVRNPADVFRKRLPKVEHKEITTLTESHSAKVLSALTSSYLYAPTLLSLASGMRRGEVLAIRWKNVDLERNTVRIVESLEQTKIGGLRFKPTKTNKMRAVTVPSFAIDELRTLKRRQAETLLAQGIRQTGETLVCGDAEGNPRQPRSVTHAFTHEVARIEGVPRVRFHDLRHSHATQLLLAGVHPKIVQERLGHSTITTTLDLYSHVTQTMQEDAAVKLDGVFRSAISGLRSAK
jgi:integrase